MKNKIIIFLVLLSYSVKAQETEMNVSQNQYISDFVADNRVISKFSEIEKTDGKFMFQAEKKDDESISLYLKNNSLDSITLLLQSNHIKIIQEAKDENNKWKPIEFWEGSNCGNSFTTVRVEPNGIINAELKAYDGNFMTEIRFKFNYDGKVYYSNSLEGNIDKTQFIIPDFFDTIWPLPLLKEGLTKELAERVVFLEPNGMTEFYELLEEFRNKKN